MIERQYRFLLGALLLCCLYFDIPGVLAVVVTGLMLEGATDWRLTRLVTRLRGLSVKKPEPIDFAYQIDFEAERLLRLVFAALLFLSVFVYPDELWWLAWFIGFGLFGAGVSGICPLLMILRFGGFK
jgi:hypothetical protein